MNETLNIVNGDACINIMKKAGIEGAFLSWHDFLHEGPVPKNLSLEELSLIRVAFISDFIQGNRKEIRKAFYKRDKAINTYKNFHEIVLWFEHDLYDQLQLLQILSWFSTQNLDTIRLTLICTNNYLGELSVQQIQKVLNYKIDVLPEHLQLASKAWGAFTQPTPETWFKLLQEPTSLLPFLKAAVFRMLEEFPDNKTGLSRTEYHALLVISNGISDADEIFMKSQNLEERKFMGDVIFWRILHEFELAKVIKREEKKLTLTLLGQKLLNGEKNWIDIKSIDRFIGGTQLTNDNLWCWDKKREIIKKYYYSKTLNSLLLVK